VFKTVFIVAALTLLSLTAKAAPTDFPNARIWNAVPQDAVTITDWYKQNVYDPNDNKIGEVIDMLVDKSGQVSALIVGVGGFLGVGEKDVVVPFGEVHATVRDKKAKAYLVMNTTKDSLKEATGFKYDSNTTKWVPDRR
jgi:sporulation protein YlmC with PRC-barrel domain